MFVPVVSGFNPHPAGSDHRILSGSLVNQAADPGLVWTGSGLNLLIRSEDEELKVCVRARPCVRLLCGLRGSLLPPLAEQTSSAGLCWSAGGGFEAPVWGGRQRSSGRFNRYHQLG